MPKDREHTSKQKLYRYWLPNERAASAPRTVLKTILVFAVLIGAWWLAATLIAKPYILPTPPQVFIRLGELMQEPDFWLSVGATLGRILLGFCLGMITGTLFAFLMYRIETMHIVFAPLIRIIQATPIVSFIIIALIWIQSSILPIVISGLMVFPVAWANIANGLKNIDHSILEMASIFRIPRMRMVSKVFLPALRPQFNAAIVSGIGLAWKSGITTEVLALPLFAIGHGIYNAKTYLETPDLFAWTIVVIILSFALEALFKAILRRRKTSMDSRVIEQDDGYAA